MQKRTSRGLGTPRKTNHCLQNIASQFVVVGGLALIGVLGIGTHISRSDANEGIAQNTDDLAEEIPAIKAALKELLQERPSSLPFVAFNGTDATRYGINTKKGNQAELSYVGDYNNCAKFEVAYQKTDTPELEVPKTIEFITICPELKNP